MDTNIPSVTEVQESNFKAKDLFVYVPLFLVTHAGLLVIAYMESVCGNGTEALVCDTSLGDFLMTVMLFGGLLILPVLVGLPVVFYVLLFKKLKLTRRTKSIIFLVFSVALLLFSYIISAYPDLLN